MLNNTSSKRSFWDLKHKPGPTPALRARSFQTFLLGFETENSGHASEAADFSPPLRKLMTGA